MRRRRRGWLKGALYAEDPERPRDHKEWSVGLNTPQPVPRHERSEDTGIPAISTTEESYFDADDDGFRFTQGLMYPFVEGWNFLMQILTSLIKFSFGKGMFIMVPVVGAAVIAFMVVARERAKLATLALDCEDGLARGWKRSSTASTRWCSRSNH